MNVISARKAHEFVDMVNVDNKGRITKAIVPGHKGRSYEVRIARRGGVILAQCFCKSNNSECKGNSNSICYHVGAVLLASASRLITKVKISFCNNKLNAQKLANISGKIFLLRSRQSDKQIWIVITQALAPSKLIC